MLQTWATDTGSTWGELYLWSLLGGAEGVKAEKAYAKDGTLPDPTSTDNPEFKIVLTIIRDGLAKNPQRWTKVAESLVGMP